MMHQIPGCRTFGEKEKFKVVYRYIRDTERVASSWARIKKHSALSNMIDGMPENWDSVKKLINKSERMKA